MFQFAATLKITCQKKDKSYARGNTDDLHVGRIEWHKERDDLESQNTDLSPYLFAR